MPIGQRQRKEESSADDAIATVSGHSGVIARMSFAPETTRLLRCRDMMRWADDGHRRTPLITQPSSLPGLFVVFKRSAMQPRAQSLQIESIALHNLLLERDLFGKPVSTFPDHALVEAAIAPRGFSRSGGKEDREAK